MQLITLLQDSLSTPSSQNILSSAIWDKIIDGLIIGLVVYGVQLLLSRWIKPYETSATLRQQHFLEVKKEVVSQAIILTQRYAACQNYPGQPASRIKAAAKYHPSEVEINSTYGLLSIYIKEPKILTLYLQLFKEGVNAQRMGELMQLLSKEIVGKTKLAIEVDKYQIFINNDEAIPS